MVIALKGMGYTSWWGQASASNYQDYYRRLYNNTPADTVDDSISTDEDVTQDSDGSSEDAGSAGSGNASNSDTASNNNGQYSNGNVVYTDAPVTPLITGVLPDDFRRWMIDTGRAPRPVVSTYVPSTGPLFDTNYVNVIGDKFDTFKAWMLDDSLIEPVPNWVLSLAATGVAIFAIKRI